MTPVKQQGQCDSCGEWLKRDRVSLSKEQIVDCDSSRSMMDDSVFPERLQGTGGFPPGVPQLADQTCIVQAVSVHHCGKSITRGIRLGGNEHRVECAVEAGG